MTIELDTTLAQAEVLFLSFAQLVADMDRRRAEAASSVSGDVRRRGKTTEGAEEKDVQVKHLVLSDDLRVLLQTGR